MPSLIANGLSVHYEVSGEGPPLVFITGLGYGGWFWHKIAPLLTISYTVLTYDNRGAGGTDKPPGPYDLPMLAADAAALLDALGWRQVCLCGHSLGGFIAQELALSRPDLVGRLILAATHTGGPAVVPMSPEVLALIMDRSGEPEDLYRRGIGLATAPGYAESHPEDFRAILEYRLSQPVLPEHYAAQAMAGAAMANLSAEEVAGRLARITIPTLILFGDQDQVVPPGNARFFLDLMPQAVSCLVPGTGHLFPLEDPQISARVIADFCGRA